MNGLHSAKISTNIDLWNQSSYNYGLSFSLPYRHHYLIRCGGSSSPDWHAPYNIRETITRNHNKAIARDNNILFRSNYGFWFYKHNNGWAGSTSSRTMILEARDGCCRKGEDKHVLSGGTATKCTDDRTVLPFRSSVEMDEFRWSFRRRVCLHQLIRNGSSDPSIIIQHCS